MNDKVVTIKKTTIMKKDLFIQRTVEKFIMIEFVKGNMDTKEQVYSMIEVVQRKLDFSYNEACDFIKNAIGINA
jgi:hypothetical protein|nr:MAG TPA: hypothetical protein [Bacteriophage sp.]